MRTFILARATLLVFSLVIAIPALATQPPPSAWAREIDAFTAQDQAHAPPRHGVLFIGSSSIRFWTTLASDFPGVPVINRGFGGSAVADSAFYADRIAVPYQPKVVVMYAGDNDIEEGANPADVLRDVKAFVAKLRAGVPQAKFVYIAIKPSVAREKLWPRMRQANALIGDWMATQSDMHFVDPTPAMLDAAGHPRPELLREDGLHMKPAGYAIWIEALKPVLADDGFPTR